MFLKTTLASILLSFLTLAVIAQNSSLIPDLSGLTGIEIREARSFSETSLYGYINGGAELYLEYGFDTLVVSELLADGRDIKVEIFRMKDTEAAFGIFSVSRFRCNGGARLTDHMCRSAYQMQFCKGPYYVSIINDTGSEADLRVTNDITLYLLERITDPSFSPEKFFANGVDVETMKSAVLVRGPLGLFNGIPTLADILGEATGYSALVVREEQKTFASMCFESDSLANEFIRTSEIALPTDSLASGSESAISIISPQHIMLTFE